MAKRRRDDSQDEAPDDAEFAEALGRAIAARRSELGLKRNDLRDRTRLSYPYIAELENGTKRPSSRALAAIAASLELRPSELLERAESLRSRQPGGQLGESAGGSWFRGDLPLAPRRPPRPNPARAALHFAEAAAPASPEPDVPLTVERIREIVRDVVREELDKAGREQPTQESEPKPKRRRRSS